MNLILDFGNTYQKCAVFNNEELLELKRFEKISIDDIKSFIKNYPEIDASIISSVINYDKKIEEFLKKNYFHIELNHKTKIPIINTYKTPDTLGKDRLASAIGAASLFPHQNVLAIDCGTAVKYDFVNSKGEYLGGGIGPGLYLRFKALYNDTDKLPLVDYEEFSELVGRSTKESILAGVLQGFASEIEGMIERYKSTYNKLNIVVTGGERKYFDKLLKNSIFADSNLVMKGLNKTLLYNK